MDMVRPRKYLWGLSPSLRPWEASGTLMDLCGLFPPVGPPRSSCGALVGRVCHCHCGSDRRSRHPVRLVWGNGSFGCRTIAATTRDLILDTIHALQALQCHTCLTVSGNGQPYPQPAWRVRCDTPSPFRGWSWVPAAVLGCYGAPPQGLL